MGAVVKLGAAEARPLIIVIPRTAVQELAVDCGAATNGHA